MKCRIDSGRTCRRCYRAGVPCIFVPRANAAGLPSSTPESRSQSELNKDILHRLQVIEDHLGFNLAPATAESHPTSNNDYASEEQAQDGLTPATFWPAIKCLRDSCPSSVGPAIWQPKTVKYLWQTSAPPSRPLPLPTYPVRLLVTVSNPCPT